MSKEDAETRSHIDQIVARLADPTVPPAEKRLIREMLRSLASSTLRAEAS